MANFRASPLGICLLLAGLLYLLASNGLGSIGNTLGDVALIIAGLVVLMGV